MTVCECPENSEQVKEGRNKGPAKETAESAAEHGDDNNHTCSSVLEDLPASTASL